MKTYDEMANSVLFRIGEYETKQKRKRKILTRTAVSLGCVCLAALVGIGVWQNNVPTAKCGRPDTSPTDTPPTDAP